MRLSALLTHHRRSVNLTLLLLLVITVPGTYLITRGHTPAPQASQADSSVLAVSTAAQFPSCNSLQYCKTWTTSCDGSAHYTKEQQCIDQDGKVFYPSVCPADNSCLVADTAKLTSGPVDTGGLSAVSPNGTDPGADTTITATGSGQSIGIYIFKSSDGNPPDKLKAISNPNVYTISTSSYTYNAPLVDDTFYLVAADNVTTLTTDIKLPAVTGTYYFVANDHSDPLAGWWSKTDRACPWYGKITTNTTPDSGITLSASTTDCPAVAPQSITVNAPAATSSAVSGDTGGTASTSEDTSQFGYQPRIDPMMFVIPGIILMLFILF